MHEVSVAQTLTFLACWLVAFAATLSRIARNDRLRSRKRVIGAGCFSGWLAIVFVTTWAVFDRSDKHGPLLIGISALIGLMGEKLQTKCVSFAFAFGQAFIEAYTKIWTQRKKADEENDDETSS